MKTTRTYIQLAVLGACFLLLARPDRLLSSVSPRLEGDGLARVLEVVVEDSRPGVDALLDAAVTDRIYEARGFRRSRGEIGRGENLAAVLRAGGATAAEAVLFARAFDPVCDVRRLRPGDRYDLLVDADGRIERFEYRRSPLEVYAAEAREDGWAVARVDVPLERREVVRAGRVEGSLYGSFLAAGADVDLAMAFVELFSWDVDFTRDTRAGDEFRVIYQDLYVDGERVGNGRILAAQYRGRRGDHTAIYYKSGRIEGYFAPDGTSVRKSFLRSPLKYTRISSRYSLRRKHPVLKVVRPHRGVDYAAPTGTPVWSVAGGTVRHAGWKGQAGKTVIVRHPRGYETFYNHLSRVARGVRAGARVKQGQVIGYVGQTGLATGPHLDFRVKKNGRWVNPLTERYPAGDPVPPDELDTYRAWAAGWVDRLEALAPAVDVARTAEP